MTETANDGPIDPDIIRQDVPTEEAASTAKPSKAFSVSELERELAKMEMSGLSGSTAIDP